MHIRSNSVVTDREVKKLACFNQKLSAAARKVEKAAADYAKKYPVKGNITLSVLGNTSLDCVMTDQEVFKNTYLHLILSDCLPNTGVETLNKTSESFNHFHTVLLHAEPSTICKMFQCDPC